MVDEFEKGVQVVPTICGQSFHGLSGEAGFEQTAPAPGSYVERRSVVDAAAAEVWGMVDGHVLLVSSGTGGLTCSRAPGKNSSRRDTNIAVTLSTTSGSGTPGRTVALGSSSRTVVFGSSVCAASAGVHAALVVPHSHESAGLAVAFAVSAVALATAAVALALDAGPTVTTMIALLLVGVAVAYALSRTTGIPGLTVHPEPLDAFGTVVSCMELMAAWALVRPPTRRSRS
ncbi:hypothetical protein ISU10_00705 [Nocardioides agariphilus]|jgi:hypothetical protein|uniref:Uncharacterized protein n=1 Tax=Nocardioides agariphilus TaxID=433664 RepID=A0A930VKM5_9ACTN|nr:hypothetical protein [Nocardioides agariphilus]MBF4766282.1 hypothetical protein [Nocardioides agariphilus]